MFHPRIGSLPDPGWVLVVAWTQPRPNRGGSPPLGMGRRGGGRFGNRPSKPQPDPTDTPPRRLRLPYRRLLPGSLPITPPSHRPLRPRPLHPRTRPPPRRKPQHPNPPHTPTATSHEFPRTGHRGRCHHQGGNDRRSAGRCRRRRPPRQRRRPFRASTQPACPVPGPRDGSCSWWTQPAAPTRTSVERYRPPAHTPAPLAGVK